MVRLAVLIVLAMCPAVFGQQETAEDRFGREVIRAAVRAAKEGTITRRDVVRLRVAMLSPSFREQAHDLAIVQMAASGSDAVGGADVPVDEEGKIVETAINWEGLAAFLEKLIPILLQLINAFSQAEQSQLQAVV